MRNLNLTFFTAALATLGIVTGTTGCGSAVTPSDGSMNDTQVADASTDTPQSMPDVATDTMIPTDGSMLDDLIVIGSGMMQYEGMTVQLALEDRVIGRVVQRSSVVVRSGAFRVQWPASFQRDHFGMLVYVHVDADRDGRCGAMDPQWVVFANNDFMIGSPEVQEFDPSMAMSMERCTVFP